MVNPIIVDKNYKLVIRTDTCIVEQLSTIQQKVHKEIFYLADAMISATHSKSIFSAMFLDLI